ncbi:MAG: hypothetical protein JNL74_16960, partial [Fibrobacteres bacterium]|nr:hypothetical protein [Fibrobacterota bacterium]
MVKFIVLAGLICSNFSFSSVLSSAAAKLKPETWGFINSNLGYDMIHAGPTMDIIWAYGSRCHWNSQTKQILYIGSAH